MRAPFVAAAALLLAACASTENLEPPAELQQFDATLEVKRVWSTGLDGDDDARAALVPLLAGERVYAAGNNGAVVALAVENGSTLWRTDTRTRLSGGPGLGDGLVVVGGTDGVVIALDAETGTERWRHRVSSEVLAPPAVVNRIVLVRTGDGFVYGLDAADGGQLWMHEQSVPSLVLRGVAGFAVAEDVAVTGYDNGRVNALRVRDGEVVWETPIATPTGRTEISRMVDVNATPRVIGRDVYAVSYQGQLVAMALESGRVLWSNELSSSAGLDADGRAVFVSAADGDVHAFDRLTGVRLWQQAALHARSLTAPTVIGDAVAVGDFDGFVHFLSRASGELVARVNLRSSAIHAAPVALGPWLVVQAADGTLTAYRVGAE